MKRTTHHTRCTIGICAIALLAAAPLGFAEDIWLTVDKHGDNLSAAVNYGDTVDRAMPDSWKIVTLRLIGPSGSTNLLRPLKANARFGKPVLETKAFSAPRGSLLTVTYDNGFWIVNPDDKDKKEINSNKLLVSSDKGSWWVPKFGKTLLGPGAFQVAVHTRLEILAVQDPFVAPIGGKLPVRVEYQGKPLAGVRVAYCDGLQPISEKELPTVETGGDGVAEIPLTRRGPYLVTTHYESPSTFPDLADKDDQFASLAFDLSK